MIEVSERRVITTQPWRKVVKPVVTRCVSCGHRHSTRELCAPCTLCRSVEYTIPTRGVDYAK
jgi:hypothetical protein